MSEPTPETPATPAPTPPEPPASTAPESPAPPAPSPQPATPQQPSPSNVDELPAWAQKEFKKLRDEAAGNRVKAKEVGDRLVQFEQQQEQQRQAFAKALGFALDEPPTVEQLTEQLAASKAAHDAETQRARQSAVELAVFRAAAAQQVDGNALLDSRAFVTALDGMDPNTESFGQQVQDAIAAAVEKNSRYKLTPAEPAAPPAPPAPEPPAVPRSGAEFGAPPQGPRQWTEEDVAHATPSQLQKAINDGLLENLGFGPQRASRR